MVSDAHDSEEAPKSVVYPHVSVLQQQCIELLKPALSHAGAVYVDATLGAGGHMHAVLDAIPTVRGIGIDRDPVARAIASERLQHFGDRFSAFAGTFDSIADAVRQAGYAQADAVLFDLGVSSMQLDAAERGFSYSQSAPLDMRMNPDDSLTAATIVNEWSAKDIADILFQYGDEKFSRRIAARIVSEREKAPIATTDQLVELLYSAIPAATRRTGGHPAKRTFQALRVAVNRELDILKLALPQACSILGVGGRIVVMSFQSHEDKIVKKFMNTACQSTAPADLPVELPQHAPEFAPLTKSAVQADDNEIAVNSRSASVRMRAMTRIRSHGTQIGRGQ